MSTTTSSLRSPENYSEADSLHEMSDVLTVITPTDRRFLINFGELYQYRDLLSLLIWRDISARYRQSVAGYSWAVLKPLLSMVIFTVIFGLFVKIDSGNIPYPLFAFSGLLPWMYFATSLSASTTSVVTGSALLRKVYFPRLILPVVGVVTAAVDLLIQMFVLAALMIGFGVMPQLQFLAFPIFVLIAMMTAFSIGIWLTALNVKYRDVGVALPFMIQIWMYLCPIIYPINMVPEKIRVFYSLNPMVGVIEGFRWSVLGTTNPNWGMISISLGAVALLLVTGLYHFRRVEATFADII